MPRGKAEKNRLLAPLGKKTHLGPRTTRSKKVFSPWDIEVLDVSLSNPLFNLDALLQAKAQQETLQPDGALDEDEVLTDVEEDTSGSSPTTPAEPPSLRTPPIVTNCSTTPDVCAPQPSEPSLDFAEEQVTDLKTDAKEGRRKRRNASSHAARSRKRENPEFGDISPRKSIMARYEDPKDTTSVSMSLEEGKVTTTGFTGLRDTDGSRGIHPLSYFVGKDSKLGFTLQEWNGKTPMALVDSNRRLFGVLAGHPDSPTWPSAVRQAEESMENARRELESHAPEGGRRGVFSTLRCGVSHGGGQTKPGNLQNSVQERKVLAKLNSLSCFKRISSFSSSVMATRAPALYRHYSKKMGSLYRHDKTLRRPFPRSIQSATTYNLGPQTVCCKHRDGGNYACGTCSITPAGSYDYKLGGHLVLWECRLVVEFPPGSTILIPSAIIAHSNTSIQPHETRYSFTQYTAGALFRWVENNFQKASTYRQMLSSEQRKMVEAEDSKRWKEGLSLLPILPVKTRT